MSVYGRTRTQGIKLVEKTITEDLSKLLETRVRVHWFIEGGFNSELVYEGYTSIEVYVDLEDIRFNNNNIVHEILGAQNVVLDIIKC